MELLKPAMCSLYQTITNTTALIGRNCHWFHVIQNEFLIKFDPRGRAEGDDLHFHPP